MSKDTPEGATSLGSKLYIFKSKSNSTDCLISAHGGYYKGTSTFTVATGVEVIFYGVHGNVLQDPGVRLIDYAAKPVQTIPNPQDGRQCLNYVLSKYQGSHGGSPGKPAETYEKIKNRVKFNDDTLSERFTKLTTTQKPKEGEIILKSILAYKTMSVVTIRNRWFLSNGDVYLKDAIEEVRKALPGIKRFHCSFCRNLVGDDNAGTSVVKMG